MRATERRRTRARPNGRGRAKEDGAGDKHCKASFVVGSTEPELMRDCHAAVCMQPCTTVRSPPSLWTRGRCAPLVDSDPHCSISK